MAGADAAAAQRSRGPAAFSHLSQVWPLIVGLSGLGVMVLFYIRWVRGRRGWGLGQGKDAPTGQGAAATGDHAFCYEACSPHTCCTIWVCGRCLKPLHPLPHPAAATGTTGLLALHMPRCHGPSSTDC
jgi:hypothetical protein